MIRMIRTFALPLGTLAAALASAPAAHACGGFDLKHPAAYMVEPGSTRALLWHAAAMPSMVGMWSIKFFTPDGHLFDFGYTQWHSDGTEFLNSGSRAPATQNYCLGVWKRTGDYTYRLNHFAIAYDANGNHTNDINIHEFVRLGAGGNSFDGTFKIDVYDLNHSKVAEVDGTLEGTRINP